MSKKELILKLREISKKFDSSLMEISVGSVDSDTFNKLLTIDKEIYNIYKLLDHDLSSNED